MSYALEDEWERDLYALPEQLPEPSHQERIVVLDEPTQKPPPERPTDTAERMAELRATLAALKGDECLNRAS